MRRVLAALAAAILLTACGSTVVEVHQGQPPPDAAPSADPYRSADPHPGDHPGGPGGNPAASPPPHFCGDQLCPSPSPSPR